MWIINFSQLHHQTEPNVDRKWNTSLSKSNRKTQWKSWTKIRNSLSEYNGFVYFSNLWTAKMISLIKLPTDQTDVSLGGQMIVSKLSFRNNGCSSIVIKIKTTDDGWKIVKKFKFSILKKNSHLFHTIVSRFILACTKLTLQFRTLSLRIWPGH